MALVPTTQTLTTLTTLTTPTGTRGLRALPEGQGIVPTHQARAVTTIIVGPILLGFVYSLSPVLTRTAADPDPPPPKLATNEDSTSSTRRRVKK